MGGRSVLARFDDGETLEVIESYNGPAELVVSDGRRYPIICAYTVLEDQPNGPGKEQVTSLEAGVKKWRGSFEAEATIRSEIFEALTARLELPDGRAGEVVIGSSEGKFTGNEAPPGH